MRGLISILLISLSLTILGQHDYVIEKVDGKSFYIHTVEKGHTLYSISKLYQVEVSDIIAENPGCDQGLSIGQSLRIPVKGEMDSKSWENPIRLDGAFLIHKVKKGETLFAISRLYKADINDILELNASANSGIKPGDELRIRVNDVDEVSLIDEKELAPPPNSYRIKPGDTIYSLSKKFDISISELKDLNKGLPEGLQAGEYITVPQPKELAESWPKKDTFKLEVSDPHPQKDRYTISMMLPFYLELVDSTKGFEKESQLREIALEMYHGSLLALDTLEALGLNAELIVLDVNDGAGSVEMALSEQSTKDSHLIIGPLQRTPLEKVCEYSGRKGIHIACPVPQPNRILLKSPNLSKVQGSTISQMEQLAHYVAENHYMDRIVLINSLDTRDARAVESFSKTLRDDLQQNVMAVQKEAAVVRGDGKSVGEIQTQLSTSFRNVIVMPSKDHALIQDLLTKLALTEGYEIVVLGTSAWLNMDFIDMDYKNKFHLTTPVLGFVNYDSANTINFVKQYRDQFGSEPGQYAFIGYDVMLYYGKGLLEYGVNFPNKFSDLSQEGLLFLGFDYYKTGMTSGYENRNAFIVTHEDYQLIKE